MINILFFIEKFGGGGAEKVLKEMVNHMDPSRFNVTVQSVWPYPEGKELNPGIRYRSVYPVRNRLTQMLYRVEAQTGLAYRLHVCHGSDIECAFLESGPTKVMAASTNKKAVKLAWVHCDLLRGRTNPGSSAKKSSGWYGKFDKIICVSEAVKNSFDRLYHDRFPSEVLYNYVDDRQITLQASEAVSERKELGKLLLLAVGTLYPPKNYPRLLWAFSSLLQEGHDLELWILGDGSQREALVRMAVELDIDGNVRFLGHRKNPYPYFQMADLLVCSSNYEGFSTVITEGLILGKPIVTTDCSGMRELLGKSEYGLITENDDEAFLQGLRRMISDHELRRAYSGKAAERGKTFSGERQIAQIERFFEGLVSK